MKQQEKEWFDRLHASQLEDLKVFKKPKYFNLFTGVIDKYSDSAHFIYELLQNADDAGATEVEMELLPDRFVFSHNGRVRFTVSNPDKEVEDREAGRLGHINSICSIGFSSKNFESEIKEIKIGKFGVGFKAVFQYTSTPEIYDDPFCFRIDDYIIPTAIEGGQYQRKGRTVFVLPFNHDGITPQKSVEEITQKLSSLDYPQLFLHSVRTISWKTPSGSDRIEKSLDFTGKEGDMTYSLYNLRKGPNERRRVLLIKRTVCVPGNGKHEIAIGYYIDHGRILTKTTRNLYCFFPTNENIGTCYVIHAPFALVDNRQQIKRNNEINKALFKAIAELAADSLVVLRDWKGFDKAKLLNDNILQIVKYDTDSFDDGCYWGNRINEFFNSSYRNVFEEEPLLLSRNGEYLTRREAWWAPDDILKLMDDNQVNDLTILSNKDSEDEYDEEDEYEDEEDKSEETFGFVLTSASLRDVEDASISIDILDGERLANNLTPEFMLAQSLNWLNSFYEYVIRRRLVEDYEINKGNRSKAPMRHAPIVKNQAGNFVIPYGQDGKLRVFFHEEGITATDVSINTDLYERSGKFREVIKELKVKVPSPLDTIRIQLSRQEDKLSAGETLLTSDINEIFIKVIKFYNGCSLDERKDLIELMKESSVFLCDHNNDEKGVWVSKPASVYVDNPILREYFAAFKNDRVTRSFFSTESYKTCIEEIGESNFQDFIKQLITKNSPEIISQSVYLTSEERHLRACDKVYNKEFPSYEGLLNVLESLENGAGSKNLSLYIWDLLISAYRKDTSFFKNNISNYFYYNSKEQHWPYNTLIRELQSHRWLFVDGELKCIKEDAYKEDLLAEGYAFDADFLKKLEISSTPNVKEAEAINEMSELTRETFALGQELKSMGFNSASEIKEMKERLAELEQRAEAEARAKEERKVREDRRRQEEGAHSELPTHAKSKGIKGSDFDTPDNIKAKSSQNTSSSGKGKNIEEILDGFEEKAKIQKEELEKVAGLRDRIENAERYSYDWVTTLMELEVQSQGSTGAAGKKALYISFDTVSFNRKDELMLILSAPSRYIPSTLEDMDSIPVTFVLQNGSVEKFSFASASVKDENLILRSGKNGAKVLESIRNNHALFQHAYIEVNEPIDILKKWQSSINGLNFDSTFSLKENLRTDIEFIFGPPGTGKTTILARRINDLINSTNGEIKILVLAPTNKACDVLTHKLHEECVGGDGWIWRFVKTDDPYIEDEELVYDRDSIIGRQKKVCVISTIARYAFDGFDDGDLKSLDWDYIFIDEASMIPLYEIILPLYNQHSGKIIISGDPFQIEPIVNIDLWKGENIYKMVKLDDFVNPKTEPSQFMVTPLMTQYRSIPAIGKLFSGYLYGDKLSHNRTEGDHRFLNMGLKENPLNVISFPVNRNSIFELKRLAKSNIQVYSVVFTVELLKYLSHHISQNHPNEEVKIGVICPYSAEIQAIQKIFSQSVQPRERLEVIFGSAHGFQGDQCDIIIAVMNPPASGLKRSADLTFVNNQNILNVAISRASDYLFLLIPEKEYENFDSLYEIKKIGRKMTSLKCSFTTSDDVEKIMFGSTQYIEKNTYVTSHKITNVFNNPFTKYEVRIDENAIDIQINDEKQYGY